MTRIARHHRSGFTLIELLVVIAVVALMISLLVGATFRFVVSAREAATATTVNKVSGIIQDRVRAFKEFDFSDAGVIGAGKWNLANSSTSDFISTGLAEVLFRKGRFKAAFPQCFNDFYNTSTSTYDTNKLMRYFGITTLPSGAPYDPKYEPGIVLYALILRGETFGTSTPGEDTFTSAEIKNAPETGGLPCLVDAWGEPLRFYRWPTRLIRCGENDFNNSGSYNDLNQNGQQDPAGWVEGSTPTFSPAIRPNTNFPGPTPASLLISNLAPFNPPPGGSAYAYGPDGASGILGATAPYNTLGWPDTDDPEPLNIDPDDTGFQLSGWLFDPNATAANAIARRALFVSTYHDFYTFHTPLIVSAGQDKKLGLYEPTDFTATCGYLAAPIVTPPANQSLQPLYDNITNLNQRVGGK